MLDPTQISTVILLAASLQTQPTQTLIPQLRVNTAHEVHDNVSMTVSLALQAVIRALDKLLTEMTSLDTHHLSATTDTLAASLIDNYATLGVPDGLDAADIQEGIANCEEGLSILASNPQLDISPPIAADLQSTLSAILGDLEQ